MKTYMVIIGLVAVLAISALGQGEPAKSPGSKILTKLSSSPISLTIPAVGKDVDRVVLDNGMVVYLYEDHRLPLFSVTSMIRCGSVYDPPEKTGLSDLVGIVMRTGGSTSISGDSLNNLMEFMGGSLETRIGMESGSANLSVLAKDTDLGLKLLADVLRRPAFPQDKLDLAKNDARNNIKRRNDEPNGVVARTFANVLYGDHPYGRINDWATIKTLTVQDLGDYHARFFRPENIILGISGDFVKAEVLEQIKNLFGDWPKVPAAETPLPAVTFEPHPGVYIVPKDINQAYINIGHLGIKRDNPDRYAIQLLNYILGGGSFTSRLTSRVRSDEGLAYRTGSQFEIDQRDFGTFGAYCQTKASTAHKAIAIISEEIAKIHDQGVTAQELTEAKDAAINRLVFNFDNAGKIVRNLMALEFDGWPPNFYDTYLDNYRKVTLDDIKAAAQKYLTPDKMTYVVVGRAGDFEKPLDEFGPITTVELKEPDIN